MKPRAEKALSQEVRTIVTTASYKVAKASLERLISLADILDSAGNEKDADRVDAIVKEATGIWDFLFSGVGGALTSKDQGGKSILDALKSGNLGEFFSNDTITKIVTNFLLGGGIGLISSELVEVLTQKVPILKWFGDATFIKLAIEGALTYAVMHSDFVTKLVEGIVQQVEGAIGMKAQETPTQQPSTNPSVQVAAPGAK